MYANQVFLNFENKSKISIHWQINNFFLYANLNKLSVLYVTHTKIVYNLDYIFASIATFHCHFNVMLNSFLLSKTNMPHSCFAS